MKKRLLSSCLASALLSLTAGNAVADLDEGLVAYYPFDLDAKDASGNEHHGVERGSLGYVAGKIGQAAQFDGDDYIEIPDTSDFMFANESLTFAAWVQIVNNDDNWRPFITLGDTDSQPRMVLRKRPYSNNSGTIGWLVGDGTEVDTRSVDGGNALSKNKWMHVAGTVDYENQLLGLYVDGIIQQHARLINFDLSRATSFTVKIGGYPRYSDGKHKGLIDEVRIYRRLLSDCEIQSLYEGTDECANEGELTQDDIDAAHEAGKQACIDDPSSCGMPSEGTCESATLSSDFKMHIPLLNYTPLAGDDAVMPLWVDMNMIDANNLQFKVMGYGVIE